MLNKISWLLWTAGTIIIVLSWTNSVTPRVGWIGFGVAFAGTVLSLFRKRRGCCGVEGTASRPPSSVVSDLDRLTQMRDRGDITEEQYLRQRNILLGDGDQPKS